MSYNYRTDILNSVNDNMDYIVNVLEDIKENLAAVYDAGKIDQNEFDDIADDITRLIMDLT